MGNKAESVSDYMAKKLITFSPDMDVRQATKVLLEKRISGAPVTDKSGKLIGMLSEKDCIQLIVSGNYNQHPSGIGTVEDYMSKDVKAIKSSTTIDEVAYHFVNSNFRRFPVVKEGRLVGQISRRDVLRAIDKRRPEVTHVPSSWKPRMPTV